MFVVYSLGKIKGWISFCLAKVMWRFKWSKRFTIYVSLQCLQRRHLSRNRASFFFPLGNLSPLWKYTNQAKRESNQNQERT